ncbi:MAG: hypothetical protein Q7J15_08655 [Candidatus Desulfaltia sp.]|nr:hypothetical protein [Candidatus Desulfaltia sp.]
MEALKKKMIVNHDGFIKVPIPPSFGRQVEIIVLPVAYEQDHNESEYFECVAEDGATYRLNNWTDDEFNKASMMSACKDDDTIAEEIFDV